jgi:hypothetical protein
MTGQTKRLTTVVSKRLPKIQALGTEISGLHSLDPEKGREREKRSTSFLTVYLNGKWKIFRVFF